MSLNRIIDITISRTSQNPSVTSFGTYGIMAEFADTYTTTPFNRTRTYADLSEMLADGWQTTDDVYKMAAAALSQSNVVDSVFIGRKDSADTNWATALNAIKTENNNFYAFNIVASRTVKFVLSADLITANQVDVTINGIAVTPVVFATDHLTTMNTLITQIETDVAGSNAYLDTGDVSNRTLIVEVFGGGGVDSGSMVVTLGVSQPTITVTYDNEDDYKAAAAWTETETKLFAYSSASTGIIDSASTTDIAYILKGLNYDRTIQIYHPSSQGGNSVNEQYPESAWPGETLPYTAGSQTWAYKTPSAISAYSLNSTQQDAAFAKNCNTYTNLGGVDVMEEGRVASGEWIDVIRGIDETTARLQEEVYGALIAARKVPLTDEGGAILEGAIKSVLNRKATDGLFVASSIVVTVPAVADVPTVDRNNRLWSGITWSADLQGAVHKVSMKGTIV